MKLYHRFLTEAFADSALALLAQADEYRLKWELKLLPEANQYYVQAHQIKYDGSMKEGDKALKEQKAREALAFYKTAIEISKKVAVKNRCRMGIEKPECNQTVHHPDL